MAKQSGLGDNLLIGGYDLSGDIQSLGRAGGGPAAGDNTGINKHAMERQGLQRDGSIEAVSYFNPTDAHPVLAALPTPDTIITYCRGTALGGQAACLNSKQINYDGTRAQDGSFTFTVQALANGYGLEWGRQATAGLRTDTEATDGGSIDLGAAKSFGLQAYVHVTALVGDDITITLEGSSDNGVGDTFAAITGGAFTEVTAAPAAERIQTARGQAVERYLRVATTGTFTSATFCVVVAVNDTSVVF